MGENGEGKGEKGRKKIEKCRREREGKERKVMEDSLDLFL